MTTKIFIMGATGYVGGSILADFHTAHPNFEFTAMVRSKDKGANIAAKYPNVKLVIGDLDSSDVITEASAEADIIFSAADCDHEPHMKAVYKGMAKHQGTSYLIHTSGSGILSDPDLKFPGEAKQSTLSDKLYDDIENVKDITSLPDNNKHRLVDRIVLEQAPPNVKQCIVAPTLIYGRGTGPNNQLSIQVPSLVRGIIKQKEAFTVGSGTNRWSNVHVQDLADLYVLIAEEALKPSGGKATWGPHAYYLAENGMHVWGDISKWIAKDLHTKGVLSSTEVKHYSFEQASKAYPAGPYLWGSNSMSIGSRGRKELGWSPSRRSLEDSIPETDDLVLENL